MNLQTRVLLGYAYLVLLLLLTAIVSTVAFQRLSSGVDQILGDNFAAVTVATRMLEELERQDSATLTGLLGGRDVAADLERSDLAIAGLLDEARALARRPDEQRLISEIHASHVRVLESRAALLAQRPPSPLAAYEASLTGPFHETKALVYALLDANHLAMLDADEEARLAARNASVGLGLLVVLALLSMGFLSRTLQVEFLQRLDEAREVATAIANGDRARRMVADRNDELGLLARQLNIALDRQQETEQSVRGQLNQQRQLLLATVEQRVHGSALLGLDGELIASSCPERMLQRIEDVAGWIREQGRREVMGMDPVSAIERTFSATGQPDLVVTLLIAPPDRPVGWIVESISRRRREGATGS